MGEVRAAKEEGKSEQRYFVTILTDTNPPPSPPAERHLLFQNTFYPYLLGLCLPVPTKFLECKPSLRGVSSTKVRAAIRGGDDGELESLVGGEWKEVKKAYKGKL